MSVIDQVRREFHLSKGSGTTYPKLVDAFFDEREAKLNETIAEMRERLKEQKDFLSVAKAQLELAQSMASRLNQMLEQASKHNRQLTLELKKHVATITAPLDEEDPDTVGNSLTGA